MQASRIRAGFGSFVAVFAIYLKECFAYPATVFLWVLIESTNALVLPAVWGAAASSGSIGGFSAAEMVGYYLITAALSQFIVCHLMWDIAWDIREGWFTSFLMRPMSFFWMSTARNLSWRVIKIVFFLPILGLMIVFYPEVDLSQAHLGPAFWASVLLAHTLSFAMAYCLAMVPFWTTEFYSILRLYYFPELFLSGRLVPLQMLPEWVRTFAEWTPFPYTIAFPAEIALGMRTESQVAQGLGIQAAYVAGFLFLGRVIFRRGTKLYTGVGM